MRTLVLATVLAIATLAPAAAGVGDHDHAPIRIVGDAQFLLPGSGVRSGSGTADDPYVIRDWHIGTLFTSGIDIEGTRAHVVIEDVTVEGLACPYLLCGNNRGITLDDAENVTVRNLKTRQVEDVFAAYRSQHIVFEGGDFAPPFEETYARHLWHGVALWDTNDVVFRGFTLDGWQAYLEVWGSTNVLVEDVHLAPSSWFGIDPYAYGPMGTTIVVRDSTFRDTSLSIDGEVTSAAFIESTFEDTRIVAVGDEERGRLLLCDNDIDSNVWVENFREVVAVGNTIATSYVQATARGVGGSVVLSGNDLAGVGEVDIRVDTVAVEGNAFADDAYVRLAAPAGSAVGNWWGDASGPSGAGTGTGTVLILPTAPLPYEPWLDAAPAPSAPDCDALV